MSIVINILYGCAALIVYSIAAVLFREGIFGWLDIDDEDLRDTTSYRRMMLHVGTALWPLIMLALVVSGAMFLVVHFFASIGVLVIRLRQRYRRWG